MMRPCNTGAPVVHAQNCARGVFLRRGDCVRKHNFAPDSSGNALALERIAGCTKPSPHESKEKFLFCVLAFGLALAASNVHVQNRLHVSGVFPVVHLELKTGGYLGGGRKFPYGRRKCCLYIYVKVVV